MRLFPRKLPGQTPDKDATEFAQSVEAHAPPPAPKEEGPERLTANEWAKKHNFNEVAAERAAMRAGKWHDRFTEAEFFELIKGRDI